MQRYFHLLLLSIPLLLLASCGRGVPSVAADVSSYSEDSAMAHFLVEPDRSLALLDSAVILGTLTPQRAEYLKAVVEYNGKGDYQRAFSQCQQLIDEESWKLLPDSEDVVSFQVDLYRLIATISTTMGNYLPAVRYAQQGAELSHGIDKLRGDEADFLSRIGFVMTRTGQYDEAIELLRRSESLSQSDDRWSSLISYLNNSKKLYEALQLTERYDEAKQVITTAMSRVGSLRGHIHDIRFAPVSMTEDPASLEEFIQYHQAGFVCRLVNTYTCQQQTDSALQWLDRLHQNPFANNPSITSTLVDPLIELGRYDEAEALIAKVRDCYGTDTLNNTYLDLMKQSRHLASCRGDYQQADQMSDAIVNLMKQLSSGQTQMLLSYAMTEYRLQDERQRREDAEAYILWVIIGIVALCSMGLVVLAVHYIRRLLKRQRMLSIQYELVQTRLSEVNEGNNPVSSRSPGVSHESIYARAMDLIEQQELFKDPDLDIITLSQLVMTNRHYLSEAINRQSGMNFRSWLAHYRVEQVKKLLLENPALSGAQLATACGFDNRVSLYRHFRNVEGMNITDWLACQKQN